jgi:hypothetical protein
MTCDAQRPFALDPLPGNFPCKNIAEIERKTKFEQHSEENQVKI